MQKKERNERMKRKPNFIEVARLESCQNSEELDWNEKKGINKASLTISAKIQVP